MTQQNKRTVKPFNRSTIQHVKAYAFTLAEVLIVIGIIGIVAALTLPNLNHATGDKEKVTKVKKVYSTLTEAVDRAQVIYGNVDTWFDGLSTDVEKSERAAKRITEFIKVAKDCENNSGCFASAPLLDTEGDVSEENILEYFENDYMVTLSDGMSLAFCHDTSGSHIIEITVDIDGPNKGKNQQGNDFFYFTIGLNQGDGVHKYLQLVPDIDIDKSLKMGNDCSPLFYNTAWVIENGNLDYLKCPEELNWETKTSCE